MVDIPKDGVEAKMGIGHMLFERMFIELTDFGQVKLGLDIVEIMAVVGRVVGKAGACTDDQLNHDPEWLEHMEKCVKESGLPRSLTPCLDTLTINIEYAYKGHAEVHDGLRAAGTEMLDKVCESHTKGEK